MNKNEGGCDYAIFICKVLNNKRSCINDDATPLIGSVFYVL